MNKKTLFVISLAIGLLIGITAANFSPTGKTISENKYTYTTAICNQDKECIDVLVSCQDNQVIKIEPTSDLINLKENWQDPRENVNFCKN